MHGENDINHMNLDELQTLENNLEMWVNNIRSQKVRFIGFLINTDEIFSKKKNSILMYCSHMLNRCRSSLGRLRCSGTRLVQYLSLCSCNKLKFSNFRHQWFFVFLFCRKPCCRPSMACLRKGYCKFACPLF